MQEIAEIAKHEITKEALEQELRETADRLDSLRSEQERLERIVASLAQLLQAKFGEAPPLPNIPLFRNLAASSKGRFASLSIKDGLRLILQDRKRPMTVRELFHELDSGGKKLGGRTKTETVRAILYRNLKTFRKTDDGKWTLPDT